MRKKILATAYLILCLSLSYGQNNFWKLLSKEEYKEASREAENLADQEFDYLYLAAVCSHLNYDYNRYYQLSDYYLSEERGDLESLTKILESNYNQSSYVVNNFIGVVKQLYPSIPLKDPEHYFSRSLALEKSNPIAHNYLSLISVQTGQFDKVIEHAKKSISFDSSYPEAYNNLAFGLYKIGDKKGAVDCLLKCFENCPKNTNSSYINYIQLACEEVVIMVNNTLLGAPGLTKDEDREKLIAALEVYPDNYLSMVSQLLSYNSYTEASILLDRINPSQETYDRYHYLSGLLGVYSSTSERVDSAVDNLIKNNAFDNALELGNIYFENQQFEEASNIYLKIIPIATTSKQKMKVLANNGTALLQLQKHDEAIEVFESVLEFAPKDDITLTNIGIVYALKENKTKAKEYLELAKKNCKSDHQMESIKLWLKKIEN